ncbi:MAG: ribbon-helix-helix protein, CopG family [Terriglobia bacterium]
MSHTVTVRLDDDLADWLEETSRKTGLPAGKIIREQLEKARSSTGNRNFLRLAGRISGSASLSIRKGFSKR